MASYNRRRFLQLSAGAAGMLLIERAPFPELARAQGSSVVRRNLKGLSADHEIIRSFERGIAKMKRLDPTDPRRFANQAAIHRNDCGRVHGNDLFWPWHRMYLYYFEGIVREMSEDPDWALPFWDWSAQGNVPAVFRRRSSPLYVRERDLAMNSGAAELARSEVALTGPRDSPIFLDQPDYIEARRRLERGPHSVVHARVGSGDEDFMGRTSTAAQDPLFWVHHANVDRLWNRWLAIHGRFNLTADKMELDSKDFIFFDKDGHKQAHRACDLIRATEELGYRYEGEPRRVKQGCRPVEARAAARETLSRAPQSFVVGRKRTSVSLPIERTQDKLRRLARKRTSRLLISLDNVAAPRQPGVVWQVFLGLPEGARPDSRSPHFIGNLALFGSGLRESGHHFQPAQFAFPADRAVSAALQRPRRAIALEFVPTGVLVKGKRSSPRVAANLSVRSARLLVETPRKARR